MTREELIEEIRQLPPSERMALVEEISRSLREDDHSPSTANGPNSETAAPSVEERMSVVGRLYGILKTDGPPPTDEEIRDQITDYLVKKYS